MTLDKTFERHLRRSPRVTKPLLKHRGCGNSVTTAVYKDRYFLIFSTVLSLQIAFNWLAKYMG